VPLRELALARLGAASAGGLRVAGVCGRGGAVSLFRVGRLRTGGLRVGRRLRTGTRGDRGGLRGGAWLKLGRHDAPAQQLELHLALARLGLRLARLRLRPALGELLVQGGVFDRVVRGVCQAHLLQRLEVGLPEGALVAARDADGRADLRLRHQEDLAVRDVAVEDFAVDGERQHLLVLLDVALELEGDGRLEDGEDLHGAVAAPQVDDPLPQVVGAPDLDERAVALLADAAEVDEAAPRAVRGHQRRVERLALRRDLGRLQPLTQLGSGLRGAGVGVRHGGCGAGVGFLDGRLDPGLQLVAPVLADLGDDARHPAAEGLGDLLARQHDELVRAGLGQERDIAASGVPVNSIDANVLAVQRRQRRAHVDEAEHRADVAGAEERLVVLPEHADLVRCAVEDEGLQDVHRWVGGTLGPASWRLPGRSGHDAFTRPKP
jgi:hypothetical protein